MKYQIYRLTGIALLLSIVFLACQTKPSTAQSTESTGKTEVAGTVATAQTEPAVTAETASNDFRIVPGARVGPIRTNTSEAELLKVLGAAVVTAGDTLYGAEGETFTGTTLYKGTADEVQITYVDEKRTKPETVTIRPTFLDVDGNPIPNLGTSRWATADGIRIGTTLADLEVRNGKPFTLWGFGWDFGGLVSNWQGGKLTPASKKAFLSIALGPPVNRTAAQEKAYNTVMGDGEFQSSGAAMKRLNPIVVSLGTSF